MPTAVATRRRGTKCNRKNKSYEVLERRQRVAHLYLSGKSQWDIAKEFNVTQGLISQDLAIIRKEWLASTKQDFDAKKAEELARIDNLEKTANDAYLRSCENAEIETSKVEEALRAVKDEVELAGGDRRPGMKSKSLRAISNELDNEKKLIIVKRTTEKVAKGQLAGSVGFLNLVSWCIEMRAKIYGMVQDVNVNVNNNTINVFDWNQVRQELLVIDDPVEQRIALGIEGPKDVTLGAKVSSVS